MAQPTFYDPSSENERAAPPLPSAPEERISAQCVLQPPLTRRRGRGPGLILLLPQQVTPSTGSEKLLDPDPPQKWAEEGFVVLAITCPPAAGDVLARHIADGVTALKNSPDLDGAAGLGLVVYESTMAAAALNPSVLTQNSIVCGISFSDINETSTSTPLYYHIAGPSAPASSDPRSAIKADYYPTCKPHFILPASAQYDASSANIAHTRSLAFLRNHLGGPNFDLEAIWDEHTYWEFERRSVAQTMATMVVCVVLWKQRRGKWAVC